MELIGIILVLLFATNLHSARNLNNKTSDLITRGFPSLIPEDDGPYYLDISVNDDELDIQLKVGELRNVTYKVKTNILSNPTKLSVFFSTSVDGIINVTCHNPQIVTLTKSVHEFSVEISAINLGQTELIINRTKDVERRNVKYGLKHSFVHVSVYSSYVWYNIALALGYTFAFFSLFGFSPQVVLNQYRKSVAGFDLAFLIMEVMDTTIYLTYTLGIFFGTNIREQYLDRNETQVFPVAWYDVMFSIVTMTIFILLVAQYIYFGDGDKNLTVPSKIWISLVCISIATLFILAISNVISWFDLFMYVPWVRILIAIFKYVPQIITNYSLKSISGLSIFMVLLEFIVGFAIVGQMTIDVINFNDISLLLGNFSKFFDGFCTFIGNAVFILQFILWHRGHSPKKQLLVFRKMFSQFGIDKNDGLPNKEEYININQLEKDENGNMKGTEENESSNLIDLQNRKNKLYG